MSNVVTDWNNGLAPGDFARYRDGTIVRVLEVKERWYQPYHYVGKPVPQKVQQYSHIRCWKVLQPDMTSSNGLKRQKQTYNAYTLKKIVVQEFKDRLVRAMALLEEENKKLV